MASKILITTGDSDGIGWEVTAKALNKIGPQKGISFSYYRSAKPQGGPKLSRAFKQITVSTLQEAALRPVGAGEIIEIKSAAPPARWVEEAAAACGRGEFQALVTAPLSKTSIVAAGMAEIGHTEILARVCGVSDLFMGFMGSKFNVVLATGHQPLAAAITSLNKPLLTKAIHAAFKLRSILPKSAAKKPIALLGLNPHAGEAGLIGQEEVWMRTLVKELRPGVEGPLVPDAAFLAANWKRFSVFVCPYHDQGLIPFKMIHGFAGGVHLTLGLPFVRTSVDHGTAKDIFGLNKAQSGSMQEALKAAIRLSR